VSAASKPFDSRTGDDAFGLEVEDGYDVLVLRNTLYKVEAYISESTGRRTQAFIVWVHEHQRTSLIYTLLQYCNKEYDVLDTNVENHIELSRYRKRNDGLTTAQSRI
jgi:hypothetical protein